MSDGVSSYNDTRADPQSTAGQLLELRDRIAACAREIGTSGYSQDIAEQIAKELLTVKQSLTEFECGFQYASDLAVANKLVTTQADHRSVEVIRFCLQKLATYLADLAGLTDLAGHGVDSPAKLLTGFNELYALQKKPLLTENLISVPDEYRINVNALQLNSHNGTAKSVPARYLGFSQTMLGVYRGESRETKLQELAESFATLAEETTDQKVAGFWQLCNTFVSKIEIPKGELSPALFSIFKQCEGVLLYAFGDTQSPVLGMQQKVDRLLVNLLCYIHADELPQDIIDNAVQFSNVLAELTHLHKSSSDHCSPWLENSIRVLFERLQHCSELLSEETLFSDESVAELVEEVSLLKRLLILVGVHGVRENLDEVEGYLRKPLSGQTMQSCFTSVQLVEQQILYQFSFLNDNSDSATENQASTDQSEQLTPQAMDLTTGNTYTNPTTPAAIQLNQSPEDFGVRCNLCIDVIQHSLDTALGSSGNLIPDSSVVHALSNLIDLVSAEGIDPLTDLLTSLSQMLSQTEDSTLNQSETLLVQEAIIAATLGIDSLVGQKPMPVLVADVTQRVEVVLQTTNNRLSNGVQYNSARSGFLIEGQELLPRLFELFQRLRGAPDGSSRLYGDINRLLHSFKVSADEAEESQLAELAHTLESTMVDLTQSSAPVSQAFFDLAIESIESLDEDIERLRNSETSVDRSDLIDRLKLACAIDEPHSESQSEEPHRASQQTESVSKASQQSAAVHARTTSDAKAVEKQIGVVRLDSSTGSSSGIDWSARFSRVEVCCNAIDQNHKQMLDLQTRIEQLAKTIRGDEIDASVESTKVLQTLAEQLQQITENQSVSVKALNNELKNASLLDAASLTDTLVSTVEAAANSRGIQVQFAIETNGVLIHKNLYQQISSAISELLNNIVAHSLPDNRSTEPATVTVSVRQNECTTFIEVADNGYGVTVEGVVPRSDNPWAQVARPDWREVSGQLQSMPPQVWVKQSDAVIDISGLLTVANRYGGTVAISSDEGVTGYRLCLPVIESVHDVLVFTVHDHLMAIPAVSVESVGLANSIKSISLASIIGIKNQVASTQMTEDQCISVRTASGVCQFTVSQVIGHRKLRFSTSDRVLPDVPGYLGVSVESEQLVMLLDIDYWSAQERQ